MKYFLVKFDEEGIPNYYESLGMNLPSRVQKTSYLGLNKMNCLPIKNICIVVYRDNVFEFYEAHKSLDSEMIFVIVDSIRDRVSLTEAIKSNIKQFLFMMGEL